jgi:hypothetical protein
MGHLARQAAIGRALAGSLEPIIFSLSQAVHVVARNGLRAEYCPSHQRNWMPHRAWHDYLGRRIAAILQETRAALFVFDGVAPYLGMLQMRAAHPGVAFVWVRRGMWQPGANYQALAAAPFFDLVMEPGDLAAAADRGATAQLRDAVRIPPISVAEGRPLISRVAAATRLGLDPSRPTALVSGLAASGPGATLAALRVLLAAPDWQVAITSAPDPGAGLSPEQLDRLHSLDDVYPLADYLPGFDVAVSAAGYNAVHELLPARIPTVLVPSARMTDDQDGRARYLAAGGFALRAETDAASAVASAVRQLLDPAVRLSLAERCSALARPSGAAAAAAALVDLADTFRGHRSSKAERMHVARLAMRAHTMRVLGQQGTQTVRRLMGRLPAGASHRPLVIRPLITSELDPAVLAANHPVEHLLPGTSAAYRARRLAIAHHFYRWRAIRTRQPA